MRDLFCGCFGQTPPASPQDVCKGESELSDTKRRPLSQELPGRPSSVAFQALHALRARLACTTSQTWSARLAESAALIADACDAGMISLLGHAVSEHRQPGEADASLVVLATGGPAAGSLAIGELLPWAPPPSPTSPSAAAAAELRSFPQHQQPLGTPPMALSLPPWEPPPCLRPASESITTTTAAAAAAAATFCGEPWLRVLACLQRAFPPSAPGAQWHLVLLPLTLAGQQVGAMLLALAAGSGGGGGGGGGKQQARLPPATAAATAFLGELLHHGALLTALSECVAECCLAPVLMAVEQVCGSAILMDSSATLQELCTTLTAALTAALSGELHVDLAVRLALLPSRDAQQGVLLEDAVRMRGGGSGGGGSSTSASAIASGGGSGGASATTQRSGAVPFVAPHRAPGQSPRQVALQQQQQLLLRPAGLRSLGSAPVALSSGAQRPQQGAGGKSSGPGGGVAAARVSALQAEGSRAAAAAAEAGSGLVVSDDVLLCPVPVTHGSGEAGHLAVEALHGTASSGTRRGTAGGGFAGGSGGAGGGTASGGGRRVLAPLLAPVGRGPTRASTFSLSSTLAAALLSGAFADVACAPTSGGGGSGVVSAASGNGCASTGSGLLACVGPPVMKAPYAVRLVGAVIANVHSYLQDAEKPTADVFAVLRRLAASPASTSLVAVAAWAANTAATPTSTGTLCAGAPVGGGGRGSAVGASAPGHLHPLSDAIKLTDKTSPAGQLVAGLYGGTAAYGGLCGGGGGSACLIHTSGTASMNLATAGWDAATGAATAAAASGAAASAPAFVLYLTSTMPLPPQLLGVIRDRAMAVLEVLLPTAARVLAGAVQDEWSYLCSQVMGGGSASALGPFSPAVGASDAPAIKRSYSLLEQGTGSGMAAEGCLVAGRAHGSSHGLRSGMPAAAAATAILGPAPAHPSPAVVAAAATAAANRTALSTITGVASLGSSPPPPSPPAKASRSAYGMCSSGTTPRYGSSMGSAGGRTLATAAAAAAAALFSPLLPSSRGSKSGAELPACQFSHSRGLRRMATDTGLQGSGGSGGVSERVLGPDATAAPIPRVLAGGDSRSSARYGASPAGGAIDSLTLSQMPLRPDLDSFPSSSGLLALEEDEEGGSGGDAGGGRSGGRITAATAGATTTMLLSTVLSDGRETAKAARQAQLDIMVSTFHTALNKARHDAGGLGGAHAEDDVRDLRLVKTIGSGGCSVVLLGRLHAMPVAVKVILPPTDDSDEEEEEEERGHGRQNRQGKGAGGGGRDAGGGADAAMVVMPPLQLASPTAGGGGGGRPRGPVSARPSPSPAARQMQMRLLMRGARELAVMTSISHPNIVQVYSYCTRVIVQELASGLPKLEVVAEGANVKDPICTALIMEYCDMGSLADAIDSGAFARATKAAVAALHSGSSSSSSRTRASQSVAAGRGDRNALLTQDAAPAAAGSGGSAGSGAAAAAGPVFGSGMVRSSSMMRLHQTAAAAAAAVSPAVAATAGSPFMRATYLTLLEVALALRHLHSLSLVHSDVKPANVLLRSSATDPRGFTAKLTDFGFVNLLEQRQSDCGLAGPADRGGGGGDGFGSLYGSTGRVKFAEPVGTVTHMAPELFVQGHPVDSSIDVFAFGILMWELGTGRAPYAEFAEGHFADVPYKVVKEGLRPRFPSDTPLHYKLLAQECWSSHPSRRPNAAALVSRLQRLLDLSCGFTADEGALRDTAVTSGGVGTGARRGHE